MEKKTISPPQLSHCATVLAVTNIQASLDFYTKQLGFTASFTWEDPPSYAVLKRDEINIHLTLKADSSIPTPAHTQIYIFVFDVDRIYQEFKANEVPIHSEITTHVYGMRDFDIKDPDGYILCFGKELNSELGV